MRLTPRGQRVLGCLIEKELATPDHYPLSLNALRAACNQTTGRDPVVTYDESDVRAGLDDLKTHQLVRSEYARNSRVPKSAHRLEEQLDLDPQQRALLGLLLLRGPQTAAELRTRAGRMQAFASVERVEAVLDSLASHRFGAFVERREREPGRRERRWAHALGDGPSDTAAVGSAEASEVRGGHYQPFVDAVAARDWNRALAQLADTVVLYSPARHAPYEGADAAGRLLQTVHARLEEFRYVDVFDADDRTALVFTARIGDRDLQGVDLVRFDDVGKIVELTAMIRPLSALAALVDALGAVPGPAPGTEPGAGPAKAPFLR